MNKFWYNGILTNNTLILKRNLKNFIFCPQKLPRTVQSPHGMYKLLHTVAICSTVCNNLLQSEARMATLCNKKKLLLQSVAIRATLCNKLLHTVSLLHTVLHQCCTKIYGTFTYSGKKYDTIPKNSTL